MPIYEYKCNKCASVFETLVSLSSQDRVQCEKCGSREVQKLISAAGVKITKGVPMHTPSHCQPKRGFT